MSEIRDALVRELRASACDNVAVAETLNVTADALELKIAEYETRFRSGANKSFVQGMTESVAFMRNVAMEVKEQ